MHQNFRRTLMPKCAFNKVALQLYWNHTLTWVFSCKFAAYFQNTFSSEHLWRAVSGNFTTRIGTYAFHYFLDRTDLAWWVYNSLQDISISGNFCNTDICFCLIFEHYSTVLNCKGSRRKVRFIWEWAGGFFLKYLNWKEENQNKKRLCKFESKVKSWGQKDVVNKIMFSNFSQAIIATAWKVSIFGGFHYECGKIRTRNMDTFYAVSYVHIIVEKKLFFFALC